MIILKRRQRDIALLACLIMLLTTFAPFLSHAFALANTGASHTGFFDEICSVAGSHDSNGSTARHGAPLQTQQHIEHCLFCVTHAGTIGLLSFTHTIIPAMPGDALRPV